MPVAYYLEKEGENSITDAKRGKDVSQETLDELGVLHWKLDPVNYEQEGKLEQIRKERGYNYHDFVDSKNIPNLQEKLATFFEEHIHDDEEIRFFLEGSGFFDIRDQREPDEPWIRIECKAGDMIVLPAGIYHRFNPDSNMNFRVMRLFCGEPVWTPHNRADPNTESRPSRQNYVQTYLKQGTKRKQEETSNGNGENEAKEEDENEEEEEEEEEPKKKSAPKRRATRSATRSQRPTRSTTRTRKVPSKYESEYIDEDEELGEESDEYVNEDSDEDYYEGESD